jgi:hypothetical protein
VSSREQWIFIFSGISATANFLAILERVGLLRGVLREDASEVGTAPRLAKRGDWTLPIILFLITLGLSVYGFFRVGQLESSVASMATIFTHQIQVITGIGTTGLVCNAEINGLGVVEYAEKYNLVVVCGISDPTADKYEDSRITVSSARTISPPFQSMDVATPYSENMGEAVKKIKENVLKNVSEPQRSKLEVTVPVWYEVAVLPKGISPAAVTRLSDIHKYGGKVLSVER